jgi:hypothetical protein
MDVVDNLNRALMIEQNDVLRAVLYQAVDEIVCLREKLSCSKPLS